MGAKIHTTLRVDEENYKEAKKILERLGLNVSQAFNIFIAMIKELKGIPFEIKIPNEETQKIIKEARKGKNLIEVENSEELKDLTIKNKRKPKIDINQLFKEDYEENKEFEWGQVGKEIW